MRKLLGLLMLLATLRSAAQYNVVLQIDTVPNWTPYDSIYVAGSINGWNPQVEANRSIPPPEGPLQMLLKAPAGPLSFKFTRGSWASVETRADGSDVDNRTIVVRRDTLVHVVIRGWKDRFAAKEKVSTALRQVRVLTDSFAIPQLGRQRRIWIYLPKNYAMTNRHYPVLYMHDGQNLFDEKTAGFGEWGVDEAMDSLERKYGGIIVVGIDHGGDKRINEYCPYDMERFGKGEGRAYTDFLVQTLKPYIDKNFRTRRDRANTWVAGSSMGGLISMYAHLRYPGIFGGSGVFSPAFWVAPDLKTDVLRHGSSLRGKVFFYAGEQESASMVPDMLKIFQLLHQLTKAPMQTVVRAEGKHNEAAWRKEFPLFIDFMMKKEA
ncbi:MAG: alpha/beta hydrolase, partial [Chitinophagaceae bacterium]